MSGTGLDYDKKYLTTTSGILKICCLFSCCGGILCIVCSSVKASNFRGALYNTVAIVAIIVTLLVLCARVFRLWQRHFTNINYMQYEFYCHVSLAIGMLLASITAITLDMHSYTIAAFFALLAFTGYACEAFCDYQRIRQRDVATQTQRVQLNLTK